jgi:hypothetical protein
MELTISELFDLEAQFSSVDDQVQPGRGTRWWFGVGLKILAFLICVAIWFGIVVPDRKSVDNMIIRPASETLQRGVEPKDIHVVSSNVGFNFSVPNLSSMGAEALAIGQASFCGQMCAVVQFQYGQSKVLFYSFNDQPSMLKEMKEEDPGETPMYLASSGPVAVVAWHDRSAVYHAIAAQATEQDILSLAHQVETYL